MIIKWNNSLSLKIDIFLKNRFIMILILEIGGTHAWHIIADIKTNTFISEKQMLMSKDFLTFKDYLKHVLKLC